jgi:hypothetical protein
MGIASLARAAHGHSRVAATVALASGIGLWLTRYSPRWSRAREAAVQTIAALLHETGHTRGTRRTGRLRPVRPHRQRPSCMTSPRSLPGGNPGLQR